MRDPVFDIQKAIKKRLDESELVNFPIFDSVPKDQQTDYCNFYSTTAENDGGKQCPSWVVFFVINCWTTYQGQKVISEMFTSINNSITYTQDKVWNPLTVDNFSVSYTALESSIIREVQGEFFRYQGVLTLQFWVTEI